MAWNVIVFESSRGEMYVEEFIKTLDSSTITKVIHTIDLLKKHGHLMSMPHAKKLNSHIYELRVRGKQEIRILYGFKSQNIYLLHGFKKQTQKTPAKEISIAMHRFAYLELI